MKCLGLSYSKVSFYLDDKKVIVECPESFPVCACSEYELKQVQSKYIYNIILTEKQKDKYLHTIKVY